MSDKLLIHEFLADRFRDFLEIFYLEDTNV